MSQENVEIVRALIEQWNTGDRDAARLSEYCDPAIELVTPLSSVGGEPYKGQAGVERWMRDVDDQFSEWRVGIEELRTVADDRVLAIVTVAGRGRASGVDLDFPSASIFDFASDHRVTRMRIYPDREEALKAAGLEE
jgi:ketosteroid isomerase-like protein